MTTPIFDNQTKRFISIATAFARGFPGNRFTINSVARIFAIPDKRTTTGFRTELSTDKRRINTLAKKYTQVYPTPPPVQTSIARNLSTIKDNKDWAFSFFDWPRQMLEQVFDQVRNKHIEFQFVNGDNIISSYGITVDFDDVQSWWDSDGLFRWNESAGKMTDGTGENIANSTIFRISWYTAPAAQRIIQRFRDGISHCILTPVIEYLNEMVETAQTKKTRQNRESLLRKAKAMAFQYADGIPETEMEAVAKQLDVCFIIEDIMRTEVSRYNPNSKNRKFRYINSRMNHGEFVMFDMNEQEETIIDVADATKMIADAITNGTYLIYTGTNTNPRTIQTTTHKYRVTMDDTNIMYDFSKTVFGDRSLYINSVKEPALSDFLLKGHNLVINWRNNNEVPINEIDMKKAYTQHKQYAKYIGFPSIINNIRQTAPDHDVSAHPGIYEIEITKIPSSRVFGLPMHISRGRQLIRAFGFEENHHYILTSPWIAKLKDCGVELTVIKGAFSTTAFHFDFTPDMVESKMYRIWTGMQLHTEKDMLYKMPCTEEFAQQQRAISPEANMFYNKESQTLLIQRPKDSHNYLPHIASFIVSYTQLNIFDECLKYDPKYIVGTKLDSIMLSCDINDMNTDLFDDVKKSSKWDGRIHINTNTSSTIFKPKRVIDDIFHPVFPYLAHTEFISGMGGGGKTQMVLSNKAGFRKPRFTSISWKLISEKINEFGVSGSSINQLLGIDIAGKPMPSIKDRFGSPGVLVIDEASMISKFYFDGLRALYPYTQFIILGDYDNGKYYQSSISANLYHPVNYHMVTSDYRSIDDATKQFKAEVRRIMDTGNINQLRNYIMKTVKTISIQELKSLYHLDYVLTGTHSKKDMYTAYLKNDTANHYIVEKHCLNDIYAKIANPTSAYLHGEIITEPIPGRTALTHAFTVHSFQGTTIPVEKKCFVDIYGLSAMQDIYTAISRVRTIGQLYIIDKIVY